MPAVSCPARPSVARARAPRSLREQRHVGVAQCQVRIDGQRRPGPLRAERAAAGKGQGGAPQLQLLAAEAPAARARGEPQPRMHLQLIEREGRLPGEHQPRCRRFELRQRTAVGQLNVRGETRERQLARGAAEREVGHLGRNTQTHAGRPLRAPVEARLTHLAAERQLGQRQLRGELVRERREQCQRGVLQPPAHLGTVDSRHRARGWRASPPARPARSR